jgi:predicted Zn-dependent protease
MKKEHLRHALHSVLLILLAGCTTVPVTGRRELNLISADQEMALGLSSFDQLKKIPRSVPISARNGMVQKSGEKRIAQVAGKDLPNAQWEFVVFDSKEANVVLPAGRQGWGLCRNFTNHKDRGRPGHGVGT